MSSQKPQPWPRLKRDWVGRYVRVVRQIELNDGTIMDPGEVMKVDQYYRGMTLEAIRTCEHCSRRERVRVRRISRRSVELLPKAWSPSERTAKAGKASDDT